VQREHTRGLVGVRRHVEGDRRRYLVAGVDVVAILEVSAECPQTRLEPSAEVFELLGIRKEGPRFGAGVPDGHRHNQVGALGGVAASDGFSSGLGDGEGELAVSPRCGPVAPGATEPAGWMRADGDNLMWPSCCHRQRFNSEGMSQADTATIRRRPCAAGGSGWIGRPVCSALLSSWRRL
jgi:hypothetical protein